MNTSQQKKQRILVFGLIAAILIIDQVVKILVKTHMQIGQEIPLIGSWCLLHFVENEGIAFGMSYGGSTGKIILTLFRFVCSIGLMWFLIHLINSRARTPLVVCIGLFFAGAVGNLIDSLFYGLIFNESFYHIAQLFPAEGGYGQFLQGRVVDMFYFPLIDTVLPEGFPFWGGQRFVFFNAIFNVADAAITIGAFWLIIDQLFFAPKSQREA